MFNSKLLKTDIPQKTGKTGKFEKKLKRRVSVSEKKFWLQYKNWTLVLVLDTETWFWLHTKISGGNVKLKGHVISSIPSKDSTSDLCLPTTTPHCQDTTALCTVAAATLNQHTPFYLCMCVYICDSATVPS